MPNLGIWEILILLLVLLIVFGPKRLPEMGRSLGKGMREFKDSISGVTRDDGESERRIAAPVQQQPTPAPSPPAASAEPAAPAEPPHEAAGVVSDDDTAR